MSALVYCLLSLRFIILQLQVNYYNGISYFIMRDRYLADPAIKSIEYMNDLLVLGKPLVQVDETEFGNVVVAGRKIGRTFSVSEMLKDRTGDSLLERTVTLERLDGADGEEATHMIGVRLEGPIFQGMHPVDDDKVQGTFLGLSLTNTGQIATVNAEKPRRPSAALREVTIAEWRTWGIDVEDTALKNGRRHPEFKSLRNNDAIVNDTLLKMMAPHKRRIFFEQLLRVMARDYN